MAHQKARRPVAERTADEPHDFVPLERRNGSEASSRQSLNQRRVSKRRRSRDDSLTQYVYDLQGLITVLERVTGGWRLIARGREIGVFASRAEAFAAIDTSGDAMAIRCIKFRACEKNTLKGFAISNSLTPGL